MKASSKKAQFTLEQIPYLALLLGVGIVVAAIVAQITGDIKLQNARDSCSQLGTTHTSYNVSSGLCTNTTSGTNGPPGNIGYNVSSYGEAGQLKLAGWFPSLGLVIGAVVIIGILAMLFMKRS